MARKYKGIERRIQYGIKGPRMETLIKTVEKKMKKAVRASEKHGHSIVADPGYAIKKRFRTDTVIVLSRAMDAIGLNPKNPKDKKIRADIHKLGQKMSDLQYETVFDPDYRRDPNKHHELQQVLFQMGNKIVEARGEDALVPFNKVYADKMGSIQIAHEEAARKHK